MEETASGLSAKPRDHSGSGVYPALVLLLTIPLSALISRTFTASGVFSLATGGDVVHVAGLYYAWSQLAVLTATVLIFYEVGGRIDFARQYRLLAALAFAGAILGNLPGSYYFSKASIGISLSAGLGYVSSLGLPEPASLLNLVTAGVAAFMIPIAGLALACSRAGSGRWSESAHETGAGRSRPWMPFVACFATVSLALPVASFAFTLLPHGPPPAIEISGAWSKLISGYLGFLLYPVLFLVLFYYLGRKVGLNGLKGFVLPASAAALLGLVAGMLLSIQVADPSALYKVFLPSNLPILISDLIMNCAFVLVLGFGAASLGLISALSAQAHQ